MILYINGYFLTQPALGLQRFASNILVTLDKIITDTKFKRNKIIVLVPDTVDNLIFQNFEVKVIKFPLIPSKYAKASKMFWEQIILPIYVKNNFLINLCNFAPLFKKNQLVVIHDVIPFRYPKSCPLVKKIIFCTMVHLFMRRVKTIATVSNFSAKELGEVTGVKRDIVILNNSSENFISIIPNSTILTKLNIKSKNYILTAISQSYNNEHKNFATMLEVAKLTDKQIVAIGNRSNDQNSPIIYTGRITDQEMKALYENAKVFLFLSLYEGFGLSPLEALTCNCHSIVSDIPIFHEIFENAVLYVNPINPEEITNSIDLIWDNKNHQSNMVFEWQKIIRKYNWSYAATKLLDIL